MNIKKATFFIGAPGTGKSTESFKLAYEAKLSGESVHYIPEHATILAFNGLLEDTDQLAILHSQISAIEEAFQGDADHIICDTFPLLTLCYCRPEQRKNAGALISAFSLSLMDSGREINIHLTSNNLGEEEEEQLSCNGRMKEHTNLAARQKIQTDIETYLWVYPYFDSLVRRN